MTTSHLNQHIFKLSHYSLERRFLFYLLKAVTRYVEEQTHGIIGLVHITKPELGAIYVPVPSQDEQSRIADFLDNACREVEDVRKRSHREIMLIREYHTRLIADVVAGKFDVRGIELPIQDKAEAVEDWEPDEDAEADGMDEMEGVEA